MSRTLITVLLALVLMPSPALSVHTDSPDPLEPAQIPYDRIVTTDIPFVDRTQDEAIEAANAGLVTLYSAVEPTARPVADEAPQSVITLFRDGIGDDPRWGALEDWRQNGGWAAREGDAHDGDWSFALGNAAGYPTDARGALILPELDLRTGFDPDALYQQAKPDRQEVEVSTARVIYDPDDEAGSVTVEEGDVGSLGATIPDLFPSGTRNTAGEADPLVVLEYWARHNLGDRQDGVQVWLLEGLEEGPDPETLVTCGNGCTIMTPEALEGDGPARADTGAFGGSTAYTGTTDWGLHYLDLTPWAEQRVWVAFVFRSVPNFQGDAYFGVNDWFDEDGFFGFQLDELQLHALAAPANLQVREPASPVEGALFDSMSDIPFQSFVRNTGSVPLEARITVEVSDASGPLGPDYRSETDPVELRPGEVLPVAMTFPALEENRLGLVATISVVPERDLSPAWERQFPLEDTNEDDNVQTVGFDVQRIRQMGITTPTVTADWVGLDEKFDVTVTVTNLGTFTDETTVVATVIDLEDDSDVTDDLVIGPQDDHITLDPEESATSMWSLRTSEVGRYKVLIDIAPPHDLHVESRPFGIGTGPPPIAHFDFGHECPAWNYDLEVGPSISFQGVTVGQDKWQCGPYGPEGRDLLYVGLESNGNLCGIEACRPYAGGASDIVSRNEAVFSTGDLRVDGNDPYLVLRHQYATPVHFVDPTEGRSPHQDGDIYVIGIAYVTAHVDGEDYFLTPGILSDDASRHYDTEETVGVLAPRNEPSGRDFSDIRAPGTGSINTAFCRDKPYRTGPNPSTPSCGWWYPTGSQDRLRGEAGGSYRPPDDDYPVGETFHGSPWKIDHIPLTGTHWRILDGHGNREQPYDIDLRGRHVEFRFHYVLSSEFGVTPIDPVLQPEKDYGWRISDLAITDGPLAVRDLALVDAELATPYDAEAIGVGNGAGADIRVDMTIANVGFFAMQDVRAVVYCYDVDTGVQRAKGSRLLPDPIEPGQTVETHASCNVPNAGGRIRIEARVETTPSDDVPFNNAVQIEGLYDVRKSRDLSVSTRVSPESGSAGLRRALLVDIHNEGNVPVSGFDVSIQVNPGAANGATRTWTVLDEVPVGGTLRLGPTVQTSPQVLATDLRYNPLETSSYSAIAFVEAAGDVDEGNDVGATTFRAVNTLYADDLEGPPKVELPTLVKGTRRLDGDSIWEKATVEGRGVLRTSDGDIMPAESDGSIVLPTIDLTSADGATLVLRHAYDLEPGYDAGRVEASTDGQTWTPLAPVPTPERPRGYPDVTLTGSNAFLEGAAQARAAGFTGSSRDDPTADATGFVSTEFDLSSLPDLQARRPLALFPLEELESRASQRIKEGGEIFDTDSTWTTTSRISEGWLLDNRTLNAPHPHSDDTMWWSGSAGEFLADEQPFTVTTTLRVSIDLTDVASDHGAVFTFWDWRAGWQDADGAQSTRPGSGADYKVRITDHPNGAEVSPRPVEFSDDGWTRREIDLSSFVGDLLTFEFHYESSTRTRGHQSNIGWFLDDLLVQEYQRAEGRRTNVQDICAPGLTGICRDNLEGRATEKCGGTGPYEVRVDGDRRFDEKTNREEDKGHCWSLVRRGLERPGAWHVDTVPGPDGRDARAWRIASDDPMGYPNLLDSRLVTPPVNLHGVVGQDAVLHFDHRYDLEADPQRTVLRAIDGGVVEYQVFDPATGAYGPWKQLTNAPVERIILEKPNGADHPQDILDANLGDIGYPAVYMRGATQPNAASGVGAPFDVFPGYCLRCVDDAYSAYPHPVSYAFSGDSGGWKSASFDLSPLIGEKVRFAFHASTNTQDREEGVRDPRTGWDVMNVAVEGTVFTGQPVQLRLRAATDDSVLDGHWTIDHIDVSGAILKRNLGIQAQDGLLRFPSSTGIDFPVDVINLGTQPRIGIALGVRAVNLDTGATLPVELTSSRGDMVLVEDIITPLDGEIAFGPVALTSVGTSNGGATWQVRVPDAPLGTRVAIQARILEDRGSGLIQDNGRPDIQYGLPQESQLANTRMNREAIVQDAAILSFAPQRGAFPLQVDGAGPGSLGNVDVTGLLTNEGTLGSTFDLEWTLRTTAGVVVETRKDLTTVSASGEAPLALDLTGLTPGNYRVTAAVPGGPSASIEFPVARPETLWAESFDNPLPAGWSVQGGTGVQWRTNAEPGHFLWGVHPFSPQGYCDTLGCGSGTEGYHHAATTPPVDLRNALNDQATLTLDHSFFFSQHDGGRLQIAVVNAGGNPLACNQDPWMNLVPSGGAGHDGETQSGSFGPIQRGNPIHPADVFQGPQGTLEQPVQTTYDLGDLVWCEGEPNETLLRDATVRLRLDVGIRDMPNQPDRPGWQVDRVGVSSGGVSLGPTTDGAFRVVEMIRNAPKTIAFEVENLGLADDMYALSVEFPSEDGAVTLLQDTIPVSGRERRLAWVFIDTSESLPVGQHALTLRVQSIHDPDSVATLTTLITILHQEKADLSVNLAVKDGYEQDSIQVVPIRVDNLGRVGSRPTVVALEAIASDGTVQDVETLDVPSICALAQCGPSQSWAVVNAEWPVPAVPGDYFLRARVDPKSHLLDLDATNNVVTEAVRVVPLQLPDLVVTNLKVDGADGRFLDAGSIVTVTATLHNIGHLAAQGATATLYAGTVTLTDVQLPVIAPGGKFEVEATKVVQGGASNTLDLGALVTGGAEPEIRYDNNELVRTFNIRTHDVQIVVRDGLAVRAGGLASVPVEVRNNGNTLERLQLTASGPDDWKVQVLTPELVVPPEGSIMGIVLVQPPADATAGLRMLSLSLQAGGRTVASTPAPLTVAEVLEPATVEHEKGDIPSGDGVLRLVTQSRANVNQTLRVTDTLGWLEETHVMLEALTTETIEIPLRVPTHTPPGRHDDTITVAAVDGSWSVSFDRPWNVLPTIAVGAAWSEVEGLDNPGDGTRAIMLRLGLTSLGNVPTTVTTSAETRAGTNVTLPDSFVLEPLEKRVLLITVRVDERLRGLQGSLLLELQGGGTSDVVTLSLPDLGVQPDLLIKALPVDDRNPIVGEPTTQRAVVRNDGNAPAPANRLYLYVDGVLAAVATVPPLMVGDEAELLLTWVPTRAGVHDLSVVVDGGGEVLELHEDNNGRTLRTTVSGPESSARILRGAPGPGAALLILGIALLTLRRRWT